jgi:RNA polymerase sigma-70 factor, ECF subfamily
MSSFNDLLEQQISRLRRYARALTRNSDRADDLVQDTLVRAVAKQHSWQPDTNLRAWLFTLMHNQYVNDLRRNAREGMTVDVTSIPNALTATHGPDRGAAAA